MQKQKKAARQHRRRHFFRTSGAKMFAQGGIYPYATHSSNTKNTIDYTLLSNDHPLLADRAMEDGAMAWIGDEEVR